MTAWQALYAGTKSATIVSLFPSTNRKQNMSFDADSFMNFTTTDAGSTKVRPCPIGDWLAMVEDIKFRSGTSDDGKAWVSMDVFWSIQDEAPKQELGRDKVTVKQGIFIDLTDSGLMDMGPDKNVKLNRLREAVGQNVQGQPWAPSMLKGQLARIKVTHRPDERSPGDFFADVGAVAKVE
jgi:hypothetical protein